MIQSIIKIKIFTLTFLFISSIAFSKSLGDLTKQIPIEKNLFFAGETGKHHYFEPNKITFKTGKLYKLLLVNKSNSKHYFSSSNFAKSIFTRKIQINLNDKKIAEIKGNINEIEVFPGNQVEWWFVPIKSGKFNDLSCNIIDTKTQKKHSEMGMIGTIIIE